MLSLQVNPLIQAKGNLHEKVFCCVVVRSGSVALILPVIRANAALF
jgi:hypothetical protein